MTSSPVVGATLPCCSLRRALLSAARGGGLVILGRLVRCSPSKICCLASSRTRARSAWGAKVGPPQEGHTDLVSCAHTSAHSSTSRSWTPGSPMFLVNGPGSKREPRMAVAPAVASDCTEAKEGTAAADRSATPTLSQGQSHLSSVAW